jgi:hypothetical protein
MNGSKENTTAAPALVPAAKAPAKGGAANGAPAPEKPKMVEVSKRTAAALRLGIEHGNAAAAAVQAAEERLQQARLALQSIASTNQGYVVALIQDAGEKPEAFANFGIWEENNKTYIRAAPVQCQ